MGEPAGVLLRGAHPAHSRERGPLRAEEMLGQLAQLLPSHLLIALQKLIYLPHPAVQKAGGAQVWLIRDWTDSRPIRRPA